MDLQAWDNIVSIASNAVTAVGVVGGIIFSGSKLKDYLDMKKNDVAFHTALTLYDEVVSTREKHSQTIMALNYVLNIMDGTFRNNKPLSAPLYFEIQKIGSTAFQSSLTISNLFVKTNNFNGIFKDNAFSKMKDIVDTSNKITISINDFFNCAINSSRGKLISKDELDELYQLYGKCQNITSEYLDKCVEIQKIKFEDFIIFK